MDTSKYVVYLRALAAALQPVSSHPLNFRFKLLSLLWETTFFVNPINPFFMHLIRTRKLQAFLCLALLGNVTSYGQTNATPTTCAGPSLTCPPATYTFTAGAEGFAGSGATTTFAYNAADGNLRVGGAAGATTTQNTNYSITSPNIDAEGGTTLGFVIGVALSSVLLQLIS